MLRKLWIVAAVCALAFGAQAEKFTFVAWNIGHFALGTNCNSSISAAEVPAYAQEYKALLGALNPRIVGLAEYSTRFDKKGTLYTRDVLFKDYPIQLESPYHGGHVNALFIRACDLKQSQIVDYTNHYQRTHHYDAVVNMDGREVLVVMTHLEPNWPCNQLEKRKSQVRQLIHDLDGRQHVILAGDFNIKTKDELEPFLAAGYTMVNADMKNTWPAIRPNQAIDHIFVKGFAASDFRVISNPKLSDHCLIACSLEWRSL